MFVYLIENMEHIFGVEQIRNNQNDGHLRVYLVYGDVSNFYY